MIERLRRWTELAGLALGASAGVTRTASDPVPLGELPPRRRPHASTCIGVALALAVGGCTPLHAPLPPPAMSATPESQPEPEQCVMPAGDEDSDGTFGTVVQVASVVLLTGVLVTAVALGGSHGATMPTLHFGAGSGTCAEDDPSCADDEAAQVCMPPSLVVAPN